MLVHAMHLLMLWEQPDVACVLCPLQLCACDEVVLHWSMTVLGGMPWDNQYALSWSNAGWW